jgi:hypothetical protein
MGGMRGAADIRLSATRHRSIGRRAKLYLRL